MSMGIGLQNANLRIYAPAAIINPQSQKLRVFQLFKGEKVISNTVSFRETYITVVLIQ